MRKPARRVLVLLALMCPTLAPLRAAPAPNGPPPEVRWSRDYGTRFQALVAEYGKARSNAEKDRVLEKAAELGPFPSSKASLLEKIVLAAARAGPRSDGSGTCVLQDPEFERGTYILTGAGHGKGIWLGLHGGGHQAGDGRTAASLWGSATGKGLMGVFPTAARKTAHAWNSPFGERYVLAILRELKRTFRVDTNRVYVGGHSMGGEGAWNIGGRFADVFAGVTANAGGPDGALQSSGKSFSLAGGALANLCNTPVWFYHSIDDPRTSVIPDQEAARFLAEMAKRFPGHYAHRWEEYDDIGHSVRPGGVGPILSWLTAKRRATWPDLVVWEPSRSYYRMFWWLRLARTPYHVHGHGHRIVARRKGNRFEIEAGRSIRDPALLLPASMVNRRRPVTVVWNDEVRFEGYVRPDPRAVIETAWERLDPEAVAVYRIDVPLE
jgi:pimeloyl-ACP methyl ester carboxylesterase